jgi:DNA-binding NarL/FixJ family response regulator
VSGQIKILLADDHRVVRRGLRLVLESEDDLEVVGEVGDGAEAIDFVLRNDVDLAVLDVSMPRVSGLVAAAEIVRARPSTRVLILSMHDGEQYQREALRAGASGYVVKSVADHDLVGACRAAVSGRPFTAGSSPAPPRHGRAGDDGEVRLTTREQEILRLIADGHTGRDIAAQLVISPKTVERHRENLFAKLGLRNRVELTRYAIREGLVDP